MHVAQIMRIRVPHPIALSLHAFEVSASMSRMGHKVQLLVPAGRPPDLEGDVPDPFDYYAIDRTFGFLRIPYLPFRGLQRTFEAAAAVYARARCFDLCYVNDCARAALYSARLGLRTVFHTHQYPPDSRGRRNLDTLFASRALVRVVTNTTALAELLHKNHSVSCDVRVAHNGVDVTAFGRWSKEEARKALGLPFDRPLVCYLGHLYPGRGVDELIEAARSIPDAVFLIVGGLASDLQNLRRRVPPPLPAHVRLMGFVPRAEVPQYLAAADVLVMPYTTRTTVYSGLDTTAVMNPMKMFEYMASGRPIVATRLPALGEVLTDGRNALLIEPDSAKAIGEAVRRLLVDRRLADRLGDHARQDATARHSWDAHAGTILEGLT
jgi:glycosyltransferase involved in cell wall biosynthesis